MDIHCWKDEADYVDSVFGHGSPEWAAAIARGGASCMLELGHAGDHKFTPDDEISVRFVTTAEVE